MINKTTKHHKDTEHESRGICSARKVKELSLTKNINEVTCRKCINKMNTKPEWYLLEKEQQDFNLQVSLFRNFRNFNIPKNLIRKVNDIVSFGNVLNCIVLEVHEKGYYYKLKDLDTNKIHAREWFEIYVKEEQRTESFTLLNIRDYQISYSNSSLSSLFYKYSDTDMNPSYQRDFVWTQKQKEALIDSIFKGLEIGRFVFRHLGYSSDVMYEIVDGKQRLNCIMEYYTNQFSYKGVYYSELSPRDKHQFTGISISYGSITQDVPYLTILEIFRRLNTTGTQMADSHLEYIDDLILDTKERNNGWK